MAEFQHVLAIPAPLYGHIYPMLVLISKLGFRGCCTKASILCHRDNVLIVQNLKRELEANGELKAGTLSILSLDLELPPLFTGGVEGIQKMCSSVSQDMFAAAKSVAIKVNESFEPVTSILSDHQLGWGQDIANLLQVPRVSLWICGLPEFALISHMPRFIEESVYDPSRGDAENCSMIQIPGYTPILPSDVPQLSQIPEARGLYWDYCMKQMSRAKEAKYILINSFNDLDKEACDSLLLNMGLPVKLVGPLIQETSSSADAEGCLEWLDMQPEKSVLFASFGTLVKMKVRQLEEILFGIEDSQQKFLVAFREDILEEALTPELASFLERYKNGQNNRGKVVGWSPQHKVLSHSAVGGLFTHFGTSSMFEALLGGVPMIGRPLLGDAFIQRRLAIDFWKLALDVEGNAEHRSGISKAVSQLIQHGDEVRANAAKMKECIHRTMNKGGDSYTTLDRLAGFGI